MLYNKIQLLQHIKWLTYNLNLLLERVIQYLKKKNATIPKWDYAMLIEHLTYPTEQANPI